MIDRHVTKLVRRNLCVFVFFCFCTKTNFRMSSFIETHTVIVNLTNLYIHIYVHIKKNIEWNSISGLKIQTH